MAVVLLDHVQCTKMVKPGLAYVKVAGAAVRAQSCHVPVIQLLAYIPRPPASITAQLFRS